MSDQKDRTMDDANSVRVVGVVYAPKLYHTEGQLRFEFAIQTEVHSLVQFIRVQLSGQAALDKLMQYQHGREVNVNGYLRQTSSGYVVVVGTSVLWGRALWPMGVKDLEAKLELLKSVDQRELVQSLDTESSEDDGAAGDTQDEVGESIPSVPTDEEAPAVRYDSTGDFVTDDTGELDGEDCQYGDSS